MKDTAGVLDSGAGVTILNNKGLLNNARELNPPLKVQVANGKFISITHCGKVDLAIRNSDFWWSRLQMNLGFYAPASSFNLISTAALNQAGHHVTFKKGKAEIIMDPDIDEKKRKIEFFTKSSYPVMTISPYREELHGKEAEEEEKTWKIKSTCGLPLVLALTPSVSLDDLGRRDRRSRINQEKTWRKIGMEVHRKWGHQGGARLRRFLSKKGDHGLSKNILDYLPNHCPTCLQSASNSKHSEEPTSAVNKPMEIIFADLAGPIRPRSNKYRYILYVKDAYSSYSWSVALAKKSDAAEAIQSIIKRERGIFITEEGRTLPLTVVCDSGELKSNLMSRWTEQEGIAVEYGAAGRHRFNGAAERGISVLCRQMRKLLMDANLPNFYWPEAASYATFLLNRIPSSSRLSRDESITNSDKTPFKLYFEREPEWKEIQRFGCLAYWIPNRENFRLVNSLLNASTSHHLDERGIAGIFMGYDISARGRKMSTRVWVPSLSGNKMVRAGDVRIISGESYEREEDQRMAPRFPQPNYKPKGDDVYLIPSYGEMDDEIEEDYHSSPTTPTHSSPLRSPDSIPIRKPFTNDEPIHTQFNQVDERNLEMERELCLEQGIGQPDREDQARTSPDKPSAVGSSPSRTDQAADDYPLNHSMVGDDPTGEHQSIDFDVTEELEIEGSGEVEFRGEIERKGSSKAVEESSDWEEERSESPDPIDFLGQEGTSDRGGQYDSDHNSNSSSIEDESEDELNLLLANPIGYDPTSDNNPLLFSNYLPEFEQLFSSPSTSAPILQSSEPIEPSPSNPSESSSSEDQPAAFAFKGEKEIVLISILFPPDEIRISAKERLNCAHAVVNSQILAASSGKILTNNTQIIDDDTTHPVEDLVFVAPKNYKMAMKSGSEVFWIGAMGEEIKSLIEQKVYTLVDRPPGVKVLGSQWVYAYKLDAARKEILRYKARIVARGDQEIYGVHYHETFSPAARQQTVRAFLSWSRHHGRYVRQYDVKTAFLNARLNEEIYIEPPPGQARDEANGKVWKLNRALYGLKQAGRAWYEELSKVLLSLGFKKLASEPCVFTRQGVKGKVDASIAVYVDDMLISTVNEDDHLQIEKELSKYTLTNGEPVSLMLGVDIRYDPKEKTCAFNQKGYIEEISRAFGIDENFSKKQKTPHQTDQFSKRTGSTATSAEIQEYASIIGSAMWVAQCTRPDIAFAVSSLSRFLNNPSQDHINAAKRVIGYLYNTRNSTLFYSGSSTKLLEGWCDSDFAGNPDNRRSTTGYVFSINGDVVSWNSRLQPTVCLSTVEAEYVAIAQASREYLWLRSFLEEMNGSISTSLSQEQSLETPDFLQHSPIHTSIRTEENNHEYLQTEKGKLGIYDGLLHSDSLGAVALTKNPQGHKRTKHIDIRHHFIRELVESGILQVQAIAGAENKADLFTKGLQFDKIFKFKSQVGLVESLKW